MTRSFVLGTLMNIHLPFVASSNIERNLATVKDKSKTEIEGLAAKLKDAESSSREAEAEVARLKQDTTKKEQEWSRQLSEAERTLSGLRSQLEEANRKEQDSRSELQARHLVYCSL